MILALLILPIYLPLSNSGSLRYFKTKILLKKRKILFNLVAEKQEKTKEYLKIMTLSESAYLQGQLLTHYLTGSIVK